MTSTKDFISDKNKKNDNKDWNSKGDDKHSQNDLPRSSAWLSHNRRFLRNPFNQPNLFQNSMVVCFVCGNVAREENSVKLYSRNSRSEMDAPFFPFLEYHDPAPGAEAMREDWSVVACSVCSALLSQQWKSFERTRMPINKRLYWLKRPSGCEIRQPVSQIELEEILSEHSKENCPDQDESDTDDDDPDEQHSRKKLRTESPISAIKEEIVKKSPAVANREREEDDSMTRSTTFSCYSCGKKGSLPCSIFPIHCKPSYEQMRAGVPYYPTVLQEKQAPGSTVLYDSVTFLCMNCLPKYKIEWHFMQQSFLEKDLTKTALPRIPLPEMVACYLCGFNISTKLNDGIVHTLCADGKKNSFYKKLCTLKQHDGAASLTFGFTYLCPKCLPHVITENSVTVNEIESNQDDENGN